MALGIVLECRSASFGAGVQLRRNRDVPTLAARAADPRDGRTPKPVAKAPDKHRSNPMPRIHRIQHRALHERIAGHGELCAEGFCFHQAALGSSWRAAQMSRGGSLQAALFVRGSVLRGESYDRLDSQRYSMQDHERDAFRGLPTLRWEAPSEQRGSRAVWRSSVRFGAVPRS